MTGRTDEAGFIPGVPRCALTGAEPLHGSGGQTVLDYWRWAHSDILENVQRGIFAEFLVAAALGITDPHRVGWTGYDLNYGGKKIEVKSSAYLQSWSQRALTRPTFSIGARQQWIEGTGKYEDARYVADCFVFCLYADTDGPTADILDTCRWLFYVVGISDLIRSCGTAKTISEERLKSIATAVPFGELKRRMDRVLNQLHIPAECSEIREPAHEPKPDASPKASRTYLVAQRKTRLHPVIVTAANYRDAQLLARANATIASFGAQVSSFALSSAKLKQALSDGALDLRSG